MGDQAEAVAQNGAAAPPSAQLNPRAASASIQSVFAEMKISAGAPASIWRARARSAKEINDTAAGFVHPARGNGLQGVGQAGGREDDEVIGPRGRRDEESRCKKGSCGAAANPAKHSFPLDMYAQTYR